LAPPFAAPPAARRGYPIDLFGTDRARGLLLESAPMDLSGPHCAVPGEALGLTGAAAGLRRPGQGFRGGAAAAGGQLV